MKNAHMNAHIIEEQFNHRKQKPQEQQKLVLENISPIWASRLKKENLPTFMSPNWLTWHYELQKESKCVVGEAYGYSSQYTHDCGKCNRIGYKFQCYFMLNWRTCKALE